MCRYPSSNAASTDVRASSPGADLYVPKPRRGMATPGAISTVVVRVRGSRSGRTLGLLSALLMGLGTAFPATLQANPSPIRHRVCRADLATDETQTLAPRESWSRTRVHR